MRQIFARIPKILLIIPLMGLCTLAVLFANEARKEVYFLCSNFVAGVAKADVIRQLNTANMSSYRALNNNSQQLVLDSRLNLRVFQCVINFDESDVVIEAHWKREFGKLE